MEFWHDTACSRRWLGRLILFMVLLLLPAAVVGLFARPMADDFGYSAATHAVAVQYGFDLPRLLAAAWDTTVHYFNNWQGLYVSGFVLPCSPGCSATGGTG